ncbi:MAG: hypothetical protein E2P02_16505 [Acidobacteria bacterium]|nr:MAG: hypothetical protein E2P02_16505 [Acidobacteriota bacterium]
MGVNETLTRNDARVLFGQDHLSDALFTIGGGSLAIYSSRSRDKEGANEDAAGILATGPVSAVADVVGAPRLEARRRCGATTLTAVEINGCEIRAFHVGDSFMLITGQRGKVELQTIPHCP